MSISIKIKQKMAARHPALIFQLVEANPADGGLYIVQLLLLAAPLPHPSLQTNLKIIGFDVDVNHLP